LKLTNKAGHKFPSGYPSRRVYVEFLVVGEEGETLFSSGEVDEDYRLMDHDETYEPHYNVINDEEQIQIYEYVVGNVDGEVTTILERGYEGLKDNRLPPRGFSIDHLSYDTTQIIGLALQDNNFNYQNDEEGSGSDEVEYRIALKGYKGLVDVSAKVYYQALPPRWVEPMFEWQSAEIDTFKRMYKNTDMAPTLVAQDTIKDLYVEGLSSKEIASESVLIYPNPSIDGQFFIQSETKILSLRIFDKLGKLVQTIQSDFDRVQFSGQKGIYFMEIRMKEGVIKRKLVYQ